MNNNQIIHASEVVITYHTIFGHNNACRRESTHRLCTLQGEKSSSPFRSICIVDTHQHPQLKCDETRPACQRCLRSSEVCPGYQRPLRWSAKHEIAKPTASHGPSSHDKPGTFSQDAGSGHIVDCHPGVAGVHGILSSTRLAASPTSQPATLADQPFADYPLSPDIMPEFALTSDWNDATQGVLINSEPQAYQIPDTWNFGIEVSQLPYANIEDTIPFDVDQQQDLSAFSIHATSFSNLTQQQIACSPIWPMVVNAEFALVEYYFKEVAVIYSCFDGEMNPFRSTMARLWTSSAEIAKTLQSMAAACLAPAYPHLAREGYKLRNEVLVSICGSRSSEDSICTALLVAIMLGQTAGWHNPKDLGLTFYRHSKALLQRLELDPTVLQNCTIGMDVTFFQNAIGYWETLYAFVLPKQQLYPLTKLSAVTQSSISLTELHPWALAAPELLCIVRQIGQLVWTNRTMLRGSSFWQRSDLLSLTNAIDSAFELEQQLLELELPTEGDLVDPRDATTPVSHMTTISQAYQLVALVIVYRVFPDVLAARMQCEKDHKILELDSSAQLSTDLDPMSNHDGATWLRQLAFKALQLVKTIPLGSHTRCIQPFLLVALSCELGSLSANSSIESWSATVEARQFIQGRLEAFRYYLPPKPAQCRLDLVLEIWRNLDSGNNNVFWVDVVIENDWQFLFG